MRFIRTLSAVLIFAMGLLALSAGSELAQAQSVDEATDDAESAGQAAEAASGLLNEAAGMRAGLELDLAASIARVNDLSAQFSSVSVTLAKLEAQISYADAEMVGINNDLQHQAVEGYMTALSAPGVTLANTENVEKALVAGLVVEDVVNAGRRVVDELVIKKRDLQALQDEFLAKQSEVAALKAEVDAEMANLEQLYAEADAALADAIRDANAADAEYRNALSGVEAAQAREAASQREDERGTTTTTQPPGSSTTSTSTTIPAPTTSTTSGGGGWTFPPVVEQWRGLVQQHFPAGRVDEALRILQCESGGDPNAYNPYSGASGLFQFLPSTWASTAPQAGYAGASVFDPVANTASAAWLANRYEELGEYYWRAWSCRRVL